MSESIQKVLTRLREPRVKITYDVETGGAQQTHELPFVVGVISDLAGNTKQKPLVERKFVYVDADNLNEMMEHINPTLSLSVLNVLSEKPDQHMAVELSFKNMDDFLPVNIVKAVPALNDLLNSRVDMLDLASKLDGNDDLDEVLTSIISDDANKKLLTAEEKEMDKINPLIDQGKMIKSDDQRERAADMLVAFAKSLGDETEIKDIYAFLMSKVALIDNQLSMQLDQILHSPDFQQLESRWRGLFYLIYNTEIGESLKVRVLCANESEIRKDLDKASAFDQSSLFKKIYEEEFGSFGGIPYSCFVGDFTSFGRNAPDQSLLRKITTVCAAAHAPFLGMPDPELFGLDTFSQISNPRDIAKIFESSEVAAWNGFRITEDSRYCTMVMPRMLIRMPYGPDTNPVDEFIYVEGVNGTDDSKFCWANPAYALASKITHSFAAYHWTASIRGVEGGGMVEGLPTYTYKTAEGDMVLKCPTEVVITDRREKELSDLGFIALCHCKGKDYATFFGGQTAQKAKTYTTDDATANATLSSRLPYMLNASRFAHYMKVMMRDKIGSTMSKEEIKSFLQTWLSRYVLLSDNASAATKAQYPLREGSVDVIDDESNPGSYKAVMFLRPHFQLEELSVSLRLVAKLPANG